MASQKTILVIGGAGYIGSHMVKDLLQHDYQVLTLDNLSKGHRDAVSGGAFIEGDLGDKDVLKKAFTEHNISAVMHFAAYSLVGESVQYPLMYYQNNVAATCSLLESMVEHNISRFIFSSTAAVYGEPDSALIAEEHSCVPTNPYGSSKLAVEQMLRHCKHAHGIDYTALRYFNAAGADLSADIGERHDPETHLIPLVLKVATGERDSIHVFGTDYPTGDGTCIRDYVHVSDLTQAHLLALEALLQGRPGSTYNLGNSKGYSVYEVIEAARRITGHVIPVIEAPRRDGDPAVLVADSAKIRSELGWQPRYESLDEIIKSAWAWHQKELQRA